MKGITNFGSVANSVVQKAADLGVSIASNVTRFIRSRIPQAKRGSSSFFQAKNQKQRDGVAELGNLAITAAIAGSSLLKSVGWYKI